MINVLVTGKNGQLGNCIKDESVFYQDIKFNFKCKEELDITNKDDVFNTLESMHYDYVINCAAYTNVDKAETDVELSNKINGEGVKILAEACAKYKTRLIHISTDYVFDGIGKIKYESSDTHPLNQYGYSKYLGEKFLLDIKQINPEFEYMIIRTSWLYSKYGKNFVKTIYHKILSGETVKVVCDQIGSPTYAINLAKCILDIIKKCQTDEYQFITGIYHYSDDGVISWFDFAKAIEEFIDKQGNNVKPCFTYEFPSKVNRPISSLWSKKQLENNYHIKFEYWKRSLFRMLWNIV